MALPPPELQLLPTSPDYDDILDQFHSMLGQQASWNSVLTSGTGEALLRFISSVGAFGQESIERAQQETINDTARLPSSLIRIARMNGVHVQRRRPANIAATIRTRTPLHTPLVIPPYSQWGAGGGLGVFNRDRIIINPEAETTGVTLYSGVIYTESFVADGSGYEQFQFGPRDFGLSDDDFWAEIDGERWERTHKGLWRFGPEARVFYENTLPDGRVRVLFGNGIHGKRLPPDAQVDMKFVYVDDMKPVSMLVGSPVAVRDFPGVTGVTVTSLADYEDARPASFYKVMTPAISAAKERAVTRDDHRALVMQYPGVIDNIWLGQAEINPGDLRWMNVIGACLLTTRPWAEFEWDKFLAWYKKEVGMSALEIVRMDPEAVPILVRMEVGVFNRANINNIYSLARTEVEGYFTPRMGSLGANIYMSDLTDSLMENITDAYGPLIDYVHVNRPEEYVKMRARQYPVLGSLQIDVKYSKRRDIRLLTPINEERRR